MEKITLSAEFERLTGPWTPVIVAALNGQHVKIAEFLGEFDWHRHPDEDELFLVVDGEIEIELRDRTIPLGRGELLVVPRGVEHRPIARERAQVLLFEPAGTLNTGDTRTGRTIDDPEVRGDTDRLV